MHGARHGSRLDTVATNDGAWAFLAEKLPVRDLTAAAMTGELAAAVVDEPAVACCGAGARREDPRDFRESLGSFSTDGAPPPGVFERLARALYRRLRRHVLLTGRKGVGKTAVVRELARRAAVQLVRRLDLSRWAPVVYCLSGSAPAGSTTQAKGSPRCI